MYSFNTNITSKPSVNELISFYKRQKLDLRDDGTRLIRPITRPDYLINNDEVHRLETLGKVRLLSYSIFFCIKHENRNIELTGSFR